MASKDNASPAKLWWTGILVGIVSMLFGFAALLYPGLTLVIFVRLASAYLLVVGMIAMVRGFIDIGKGRMWFLQVLVGLFELAIGVYLLRHEGVAVVTFVVLLGLAFIVNGVGELIGAFDPQNEKHKWLMIILGLVGILAGVAVLVYPGASSLAFVWVVGLYALIMGPIWIVMAFRLKDDAEEMEMKKGKSTK